MSSEILTVSDTSLVRPFPVHDDGIRARLADSTLQEEKRRHLLTILRRPTPPWDPADHPDIEKAGGAADWVKELRREAERGFEKRTRAKERG